MKHTLARYKQYDTKSYYNFKQWGVKKNVKLTHMEMRKTKL